MEALRKKLAELVALWTEHGTHSAEVQGFLNTHKDDKGFMDIAKKAIQLKDVIDLPHGSPTISDASNNIH